MNKPSHLPYNANSRCIRDSSQLCLFLRNLYRVDSYKWRPAPSATFQIYAIPKSSPVASFPASCLNDSLSKTIESEELAYIQSIRTYRYSENGKLLISETAIPQWTSHPTCHIMPKVEVTGKPANSVYFQKLVQGRQLQVEACTICYIPNICDSQVVACCKFSSIMCQRQCEHVCIACNSILPSSFTIHRRDSRGTLGEIEGLIKWNKQLNTICNAL